jgi:UrcA family protein
MFRLAGAAFAAVLATQAALAGDGFVTVRSVQVAYGDLDLGSPSGRAVLQGRVDAAVRKVCGPNPVFHVDYHHAGQFLKADYTKCRAEATYEAVAALKTGGAKLAVAY